MVSGLTGIQPVSEKGHDCFNAAPLFSTGNGETLNHAHPEQPGAILPATGMLKSSIPGS